MRLSWWEVSWPGPTYFVAPAPRRHQPWVLPSQPPARRRPRKSRHERERAEDVLGNALRQIKPRDAA
jgi:hypothetical protein